MGRPLPQIMRELRGQLDDLEEYIALHVRRGESLQIVLFIDADGRLGRAKWTGTGSLAPNRQRPAITSLQT